MAIALNSSRHCEAEAPRLDRGESRKLLINSGLPRRLVAPRNDGS